MIGFIKDHKMNAIDSLVPSSIPYDNASLIIGSDIIVTQIVFVGSWCVKVSETISCLAYINTVLHSGDYYHC